MAMWATFYNETLEGNFWKIVDKMDIKKLNPVSSSSSSNINFNFKKILISIFLVFALSILGTLSFFALFPVKPNDETIRNSDTFTTVERTTENVPLLTNDGFESSKTTSKTEYPTGASSSTFKTKPPVNNSKTSKPVKNNSNSPTPSENPTINPSDPSSSSSSVPITDRNSNSFTNLTSSSSPSGSQVKITETTNNSNHIPTISQNFSDPIEYSESTTQSVPPENTKTTATDSATSRHYPVNRMVGLQNRGNTCYFNVIVQMLYHIADFRKSLDDYLETIASGRIAFQDHLTTKHFKTAKALHKVFTQMDAAVEDNSGKLFVIPERNCAVRTENAVNQEFDASEVLTYYTEFKGFDWSAFTFQIKTMNTRYYLLDNENIQNITDNVDKSQELLLDFPIQRNEDKTLSDFIADNFAVHERDLSEIEIANGYQSATLQYNIVASQLPKYLIIRLKRFKYDGTKIFDKVDAEEILDLEPFFDEKKGNNVCKYRLVSYVLHIEKVFSRTLPKTKTTPEKEETFVLKHYVSYLRSDHDRFTLIDDSVTKPIDHSEFMEMAREGYIYFYERIDNN